MDLQPQVVPEGYSQTSDRPTRWPIDKEDHQKISKNSISDIKDENISRSRVIIKCDDDVTNALPEFAVNPPPSLASNPLMPRKQDGLADKNNNPMRMFSSCRGTTLLNPSIVSSATSVVTDIPPSTLLVSNQTPTNGAMILTVDKANLARETSHTCISTLAINHTVATPRLEADRCKKEGKKVDNGDFRISSNLSDSSFKSGSRKNLKLQRARVCKMRTRSSTATIFPRRIITNQLRTVS
eukprot:817671_1